MKGGMNIMSLKKLGILFGVLLLAGLFGGAACAQDVCGEPTTVTLYASKDIPVGTVSIWNNEGTLYVMYRITSEEWDLGEAHLAIAQNVNQIPRKKGGPIPGKFPYKMEFEELGVKEYIFEIPLGSWTPGTYLVVAAHAQIYQIAYDAYQEPYFIYESAWADGTTFSRRGWAMWFNYMVQYCQQY